MSDQVEVTKFKLPLDFWLKLMGIVLTPVACGAWFMATQNSNICSNTEAIKRSNENIEEIATSLKDIVRHEHRIDVLESEMRDLEGVNAELQIIHERMKLDDIREEKDTKTLEDLKKRITILENL